MAFPGGFAIVIKPRHLVPLNLVLISGLILIGGIAFLMDMMDNLIYSVY